MEKDIITYSTGPNSKRFVNGCAVGCIDKHPMQARYDVISDYYGECIDDEIIETIISEVE